MRPVYHYCCKHAAQRITRAGFLRPSGFNGYDVLWVTDQAIPDRMGLGLTSGMLKCDRLEFQYIAHVLPDVVTPWLDSPIRRELAQSIDYGARGFLREFEHGHAPSTWLIATRPIFATRNEQYRPPGDLHPGRIPFQPINL